MLFDTPHTCVPSPSIYSPRLTFQVTPQPHPCTCAIALECRDRILALFQLGLQPYVDMIDKVGEERQREGNGCTVLLGS